MSTNNSINSVLIGSAQKSAFGDMLVAQIDTLIQLQFNYGLLSTYVNTATTGSGSCTSSDNFAVAQSGAASSSSATITSIDRLHYQPGQGMVGMFTAVYTNAVTGNTQIVGVGNEQDGFFFGYNGTSFGILHRNNLVDTWIDQSSWNYDTFDGTGSSGVTLDPTKGNVFKIQFQWLGFGAINFFIENQNTGTFTQVHQIKYANQNTSTSLANPSLQLYIESKNTTNTTNITTKTPSMCAYVEGQVNNIDTRFSVDASASISTSEVNLMSVQNRTTFQTKTNQTMMLPDMLGIYNAGAGGSDAEFYVYMNADLGGSPVFTPVSPNLSVAEYDTAGTTISNGRLIFTFHLGGGQTENIYLSDFNIKLAPGETLTIGAKSLSGSKDLHCALSWQERF